MSLRVYGFSPNPCAKYLSERGRGSRGKKEQKVAMGEEKAREREGRSSARWLYGMSRLCLARVRNVIHTPLAFRHVPFRSRLRLLLSSSHPRPLTKLQSRETTLPFPPTCEAEERVVSQLRPVKYRARRKCR